MIRVTTGNAVLAEGDCMWFQIMRFGIHPMGYFGLPLYLIEEIAKELCLGDTFYCDEGRQIDGCWCYRLADAELIVHYLEAKDTHTEYNLRRMA